MQLQIANRKRVKIKMALQGPSGSGKTMSALLVAFGLCNDWSKIAVIDTENHSSELYAHLGAFHVLHLASPFTPERYIEAILVCENAGIEVVIIDSISHEWEGILEVHGNMAGNSYTNWNKLTPRHNAFVQHILQSPVHVIGTVRAKQEYVLHEKNGKQVPEKVGMKGVTREGMDYEFTLVFELDIKNQAIATKDRTSLFIGKPEFKMTSETGTTILEWCNQSSLQDVEIDVKQRINDCRSIAELLQFYQTHPQYKEEYQEDFTKRKRQLTRSANSKSSQNGVASKTE